MNNNDIKRLWQRRGVDLDPSVLPIPQEEKEVELSDQQKLLVNVYALDPLTNKPMNDLVLTENGNLDPVIREFIKQNLQAPVQPEDAPSDYGISEELCRRADETVFEYQQRLRQLTFDSAEYINTANKKIRSANAR